VAKEFCDASDCRAQHLRRDSPGVARPSEAARTSTEAEVRASLDGAVRPAKRIGLGSALATLANPFAGLDLKIKRDKRFKTSS
jgi:hypothetical protein